MSTFVLVTTSPKTLGSSSYASRVSVSIPSETVIANTTAILAAINTILESQVEASTVTLTNTISTFTNSTMFSFVTVSVSPIPASMISSKPTSETVTETLLVTETSLTTLSQATGTITVESLTKPSIIQITTAGVSPSPPVVQESALIVSTLNGPVTLTVYTTVTPSISLINNGSASLSKMASVLSTILGDQTETRISPHTTEVTALQVSTLLIEVISGTVTFWSSLTVTDFVTLISSTNSTFVFQTVSVLPTATETHTQTQISLQTTVVTSPVVSTSLIEVMSGTVIVWSSLTVTEYVTFTPTAAADNNSTLVSETVSILSTATEIHTETQTRPQASVVTVTSLASATEAQTKAVGGTVSLVTSLTITNYITLTLSVSDNNSMMSFETVLTATPAQTERQAETQAASVTAWTISAFTSITIVDFETTLVIASPAPVLASITLSAGVVTTTLVSGTELETSTTSATGTSANLTTVTGTQTIFKTGTQTSTETATLTFSVVTATSPSLTSSAQAASGTVPASSLLPPTTKNLTFTSTSKVFLSEGGPVPSPGTETVIVTITVLATEAVSLHSTVSSESDTMTILVTDTIFITENASTGDGVSPLSPKPQPS